MYGRKALCCSLTVCGPPLHRSSQRCSVNLWVIDPPSFACVVATRFRSLPGKSRYLHATPRCARRDLRRRPGSSVPARGRAFMYRTEASSYGRRQRLTRRFGAKFGLTASNCAPTNSKHAPDQWRAAAAEGDMRIRLLLVAGPRLAPENESGITLARPRGRLNRGHPHTHGQSQYRENL